MLRHNLMCFSIFISAAPIAAAPGVTSVIHLREHTPPITPMQARALTPSTLGDALLMRGHPPVTEAIVGPEGMEPPTPPGRPTVTRIRLFLEASRSQQPGFCERIVATVFLKPVDQLPDGTIPASGPDTISTQIAYRWVGTGGSALACAAAKSSFFMPHLGDERQAMAVVRLLALAKEEAEARHKLPFPVSVVDREGPEMAAFDREHPTLPPAPKSEIMTDARKALASLPVDAVTYVGPAATATPDILLASDLADAKGRHLESMTVFLGGDWTAGIVLAQGEIVQLRLLREIPPPF